MSSSSIGDVEYYQQSAQTSVTAFLAKLWALVNDTTCDDLIAWDASGNSFHVYDQSRFAREILPRYFKHNNFASFIRQLNMYGFRKISTIEHGSLKAERDDIEFAHQYFIRGHDALLEQIKRRAPDHQHKINIQPSKTEPMLAPTTSPTPVPPVVSSSAVTSTTVYTDSKGSTRPVEFSQVLDDVRNLHAKQTSLTDKLFHMQDENQALWREVGMLKQKHAKQQQIVSKLMEFLLHFLTSSTQSHRPSVEQPSPRQSQQEQTEHHTITSQPIPAHSLKRKPAALMLSDEPKKRTTMQQHQHLLSQPITIIGRPQGITINELTENDPSSWLHTTDTSPLVDLVPSPPPTQTLDDTYPHQQPPPPLQQPPNNYEWSVSGDELRNSLNKTLKTMGNGAGDDSTYIPDFFLTSDLPNGADKSAIDPIDPTNLAGINTSSSETLPILKEERIEFPSSFHSHASEPIVLNPSIYPNTKREKAILNNTTPFSLDDITGDVDHIQSSLDNIRELMFDHLPDNPTIEDLFCDDPALLSPLLTNNGQTTNILAEPGTEPRSLADVNSFIYPVANATNNLSPCKQIILHKSEMPVVNAPADVSNQLLEQLMHETAKVDEHRQAISQLNREKLSLDGHLAPLEQQFNGRNQP